MSLYSTPSIYMSLPVPNVGADPGPQYAIDINQCLTLIDQHNHSPGSGAPITPASLLINSDLSIQGNSLTSIKSIQLSPLSSFATALSVYIKPGSESAPINDLWFNDGNGTAIQITEGGLVKATLTSLPGQSYSAGTFVWKQGSGSTTPADFDIGSITLRPHVAATVYGITLQVDPALSSTFDLTLDPSLNVSDGITYFLELAPGRKITKGVNILGSLTTANLSATAGIVGSQLAASAGILGTQLANNTITATQIASGVIPTSQTQTFTTPGTTAWVAPVGVNWVMVELIGGGGGGGFTGHPGNGATDGAGGGSSAIRYIQTVSVTPGSSYNVIVGGAGSGGNGFTQVAATNGGTSSFNGVSSTGGHAGGSVYLNGAGAGGASNFGNPSFGYGGSGDGGAGGYAPNAIYAAGSAGGGSAGGGGGGASDMGSGGNGGYGDGGISSQTGYPGANATGNGAGGGGAGGGVQNIVNGGNGSAGFVKLSWVSP